MRGRSNKRKYVPMTAPSPLVTAPCLLSWDKDYSLLLYSRYHEVTKTTQAELSLLGEPAFSFSITIYCQINLLNRTSLYETFLNDMIHILKHSFCRYVCIFNFLITPSKSIIIFLIFFCHLFEQSC